MHCSKCGVENRQAARFCDGCGSALRPQCVSCGALNRVGAKFCDGCGAPLTGSVRPAPTTSDSSVRFDADIAAADVTDGERKMVTALFADIKGSMDLMEELDPEEARAIVDPALKLMIDAVHRYGGYIVQSTGDGIFALFGAPIAHEDHPQRTLFAALRLQEQLSRYSSQLREQGRMPLQARVGLNTGDVVVRSIETGEGHNEYTPIGHSTSLAARIQSLAPVGSIATTDTTRKLSEGYFTFKSLGPTVVKGVSEPIDVFEVTGLGPLRRRFQRSEVRGLTKFVGRLLEMEALKHAAQQAGAGHGQIVAVMADPGVGKSRLFHEFKATSPTGWTVLEAFSVSYGKASAYLPVLELLSAYFEISRDDDERKRHERILGKVLALDRSLEDSLPYLYSLCGIVETDDSLARIDPRLRRRRTQEAIKRIILQESLNQPLIIIFEDLHWIDSETQALLDMLVDAIAPAPILLLVNYRPEYPDEWANRSHYTQLRLDPLGTESAEEMLSALLGDGKDLNPLKRQIVERTQGTPFFMEEMVQALFEEGVLRRNGSVKLTQPMSTVKVPATVQAVLASRIDRLPGQQKELLQALAVLGREFPLALVQRVTAQSNDELEPMLNQLELGEFIFERQAASDDIEYIFKHALTQEVVYNSILGERRRALHNRAASAIENLYRNQLESHYNDLAHHYLRTTNVAKATHYARLAAEQALSRAAYSQTLSLIGTALNLVEKLPEESERSRTELALRTIESTVASVLHGSSSSQRERAIRRMCELAESIAEGDVLVRALSTLSVLYLTRGESALGLELVRRCIAMASGVQDSGFLADLVSNAGMLAWSCGNLREAASHFREAAPHFEVALREAHKTGSGISPQTGILYGSQIPSRIALNLQQLGRVGEAALAAQESLRCARQARHLHSLAFALVIAGGLVAQQRRQTDLARAYSEEGIAVSEENGFAEWLPWGRFIHGWALSEQGRAAEGFAEMEAGIVGFEHLGGVPRLQYLKALRAERLARNGRRAEAVQLLDRSLTHIQETGERVDHAEILRLKGEVLLMCEGAAIAEAEKCFGEALHVARVQEAKWWELRASVSLARLLGDTNRRDEARAMLSGIYNWFTEGFELPDLKEAKELLDELNG